MAIIKLIPAFIVLFLSTIFLSCDEKKSVMTIDQSKLSMVSGANRSVLIEGGYPEYSVVSRNESIATASITDDMLIVTALQSGETVLTIFDTESSIVVVPIVVHPYSSQTILKIDSLYIRTVIKDQNIKNIIENELISSFSFSLNTHYVLGFKAEGPGDLLICPGGKDINHAIEGIFNIEKAEQNLSYHFSYENESLTYQIEIVDLATKTSPIEIVKISLTEDLTEYYQSIYPDAGVEKVLRGQLTIPETISFN